MRCGIASFSSCNCLVISSSNCEASPVRLPPGRARLCTKPSGNGIDQEHEDDGDRRGRLLRRRDRGGTGNDEDIDLLLHQFVDERGNPLRPAFGPPVDDRRWCGPRSSPGRAGRAARRRVAKRRSRACRCPGSRSACGGAAWASAGDGGTPTSAASVAMKVRRSITASPVGEWECGPWYAQACAHVRRTRSRERSSGRAVRRASMGGSRRGTVQSPALCTRSRRTHYASGWRDIRRTSAGAPPCSEPP